MSQNEDEVLDRDEEKNPSAFGWLSVIVSIFFIVRSMMHFSNNNPGMGILLFLVGSVGLIWKIYELSKQK